MPTPFVRASRQSPGLRSLALLIVTALFFSACSTATGPQADTASFSYLALGDSYTIGASVDPADRWPEQLMDLAASAGSDSNTETPDRSAIAVSYVATNGWTTQSLLGSLRASPPRQARYDLVTLLIGVNNQFRGWDFGVYEQDVPELFDIALEYVGQDASRMIVVSIPDYAYTPYGERRGSSVRQAISTELDQYNNWMQTYAASRGVSYVYITDITRRGLEEPDLVADDELHPSGTAYAEFAARILEQHPDILAPDVDSVASLP